MSRSHFQKEGKKAKFVFLFANHTRLSFSFFCITRATCRKTRRKRENSYGHFNIFHFFGGDTRVIIYKCTMFHPFSTSMSTFFPLHSHLQLLVVQESTAVGVKGQECLTNCFLQASPSAKHLQQPLVKKNPMSELWDITVYAI